MKLLKNANLYTPKSVGKKDILIEGGKILRVDDEILGYDNLPDVEVIDLDHKITVPGYIDMHVHITGGGGEGGPTTRVAEAKLGELLRSGITTVVGMLGTDSIGRSLENLIMKARALNEEGITCYALTGAYGYPSTTLLGSVERDIALMDVFIGAKIAMSDHRSSNPSAEGLIDIGTQARRAGLLSGSCGLVTIHMGGGKEGLNRLFEALDSSDVPIQNFLPTHMASRDQKLLDDGIQFIKRGGTVDFTVEETYEENKEIAEKLMYCLDQGCPIEQITITSDGYGSAPRFDEKGAYIGLTYANPCNLHRFIKLLVEEEILPLEKALTLLTENPARVLHLSGTKGVIAPGADGDILVLDEGLNINSLFAKGKTAIWNGTQVMKGQFEL